MTTRRILVGVAAILALGANACVNIDSGHRGVKWKAIGGTVDEPYGEGLKLLWPWDRMYVYSVRYQDRKEDLRILSKNGLQIEMEVSIRYNLKEDSVFEVHTELGPNYYNEIIAPTMRSEARKVAGRYLPEEIYSTKRETLEEEIMTAVRKPLETRSINVRAILIRDVDLPEKLRRAITEKLEEEQRSLKMEYTLQREKQEAERKRIEAQGISDFQKIVVQGIDQRLLQWKGIEATENLAKSQNTKIVIVGSSRDGLPIILGK